MKIGFTERGDAGWDLSWYEGVHTKKCNGLIAITKNITPGCHERLIALHNSGFPVILHAGITGMPKSVEPCTPAPEDSIQHIQALIADGFPQERIVLRVDPIVPVGKGIGYATHVLDLAYDAGLLPHLRVRVSVLDNYPHVRERFRKAFGPKGVLYNGDWSASPEEFDALTDALRPYVQSGKTGRFECCAEGGKLTDETVFEHIGCISVRDITALGLTHHTLPSSINGQNRHGCLCLNVKCELLNHKHPCPNGCLYCYWKDPA